MLHTDLVDDAPAVVWQSCDAGEHVFLPPGAWHLTAVLAAPAAVFNIYTGAEPPDGGTPAELPKYHRAAPPHLTVTSDGGHPRITTDPADPTGASTWPVHRRTAPPDWAARLTGPRGLAALYLDVADPPLARLHDHTRRHAANGTTARR
jgi:hypothetical protein